MADKQDGPTKADWVAAGLSALTAGGIEAVRVERLAVILGVSKGPFYWRFKNRGELLEAIIEFWKRDFTADLIEQTSHFDTPRERLEALAELAVVSTSGALDVAKTECALRAWAAQDPLPRAAVREVDAMRTKHLTEEFKLLGAPHPLAEQLAKAIYLALLGLYTVRQYTPELADEQSYLTAVRIALDAAQIQSHSTEVSAAKSRLEPDI
ncbi:TetR/AcrR family transcriptional regulator [Sinorhizobium meliloti]|uniref:TetR/AcrR family transcriptional regulator n=1 Tax=Rhizobium meliloti TaxID=382 RepID=UPI000FD7836C|nr:TetR/AcrR family transcriptional regulator [Sinorhizobium meliloti]RVI81920.1 TetR/AcrR family transcriptional regulator [Sinorhizobium meliloti]